MNQAERISAEVQHLNEERERAAAMETRKLINTILSIRQQINDLNATLASTKKLLSEVSYTPISIADIQ